MDPIPRPVLEHGGAEDHRVATVTRIPLKMRVESNDPFLSQAHAEIHTPTQRNTPPSPDPKAEARQRSSLLGCNSYRCRIVKEQQTQPSDDPRETRSTTVNQQSSY